MYKMGDFDTPIPDQDIVRDVQVQTQYIAHLPTQNEDQELWRPYPRHVLGPTFTPMASHVMTCFRAQCKLCELRIYGSATSTDFCSFHHERNYG